MTRNVPQVFDRITTLKLHLTIFLSLLPIAALSFLHYGWYALFLIVSTVLVTWAADRLLTLVQRKDHKEDFGAPLWGLLLAYCMPPHVPFLVPWIGAFFAIFAIKGLLGGSGAAWVNPVLISWAFCQSAWPEAMRSWALPKDFSPDAVAAATPLTLVKQASLSGDLGGATPMAFLAGHGLQRSSFDLSTTDWLNNHLFSWLNVNLPGGYVDLVTGNIAGSLGEAGTVLLLAATVFLLARGFLPWIVPTVYFLSFTILIWAFGGLPYQHNLFTGDVLFQIFSGSFLLGIFFLAPETSSRPLTQKGQAVYALCAGILTFVLRVWGTLPEGTGYAILLLNFLVPWLDQKIRVRKGGSLEIGMKKP